MSAVGSRSTRVQRHADEALREACKPGAPLAPWLANPAEAKRAGLLPLKPPVQRKVVEDGR